MAQLGLHLARRRPRPQVVTIQFGARELVLQVHNLPPQVTRVVLGLLWSWRTAFALGYTGRVCTVRSRGTGRMQGGVARAACYATGSLPHLQLLLQPLARLLGRGGVLGERVNGGRESQALLFLGGSRSLLLRRQLLACLLQLPGPGTVKGWV